MPCRLIEIEVISPIILSNSASTSGLHTSRKFIQGSRLLGIAAAAFHWNDTDLGFRLFRSGSVKFGCGFPVIEGEVKYPTPRSFHKGKDDASSEPVLTDRSNDDWSFEANGQPKQLKKGFLGPQLSEKVIELTSNYRLKSAHDRTRGSAKQAQLFGYDYLLPGQKFVAEISADSREDLSYVIDKLLVGRKRIGRSKASEFGEVDISKLDQNRPPMNDMNGEDGFSIWAISDLFFIDNNGRSNLRPGAKDFGVTGGEIDWENSYVCRAVFAPFNGALGGREATRNGFGAGSVFRISPVEGTEQVKLQAKYIRRGIGSYLEAGSGRILCTSPEKNFQAIRIEKSKKVAVGMTSDTYLIELLLSRKKVETQKRRTIEYLEGVVSQDLLKHIQRLSRTERPTKSQWRQVLDQAIKLPPTELVKALFHNPSDGKTRAICNREDWTKISSDVKKWIENAVEENMDLPSLIRRFIAVMQEESCE